MPGSFLDSNVILYLASGDLKKADRAEAIVAAGGSINVQVLNEVTNVLRRKIRLSWVDTHAFLGPLRRLLSVHPLTIEIHDAGLRLAERHRFSLYDAMIVAAALAAGCETLQSEDMQHGMILEGVLHVVDPFRGL